MAIAKINPVYTATVNVTGGRQNGKAVSDDGVVLMILHEKQDTTAEPSPLVPLISLKPETAAELVSQPATGMRGKTLERSWTAAPVRNQAGCPTRRLRCLRAV